MMMTPTLTAFVAILLLAWALAMVEVPVVRGCLLSSGITESRFFKISLPLLAMAALALPFYWPLPFHTEFFDLLRSSESVPGLGMAVTALLAVLFGLRISQFVPLALAVAGTVFGNMLAGSSAQMGVALRMALPWLAGPVIAALLSALIYKVVDALMRRSKLHLLKMDHRMRLFLELASVLLMLATLFNIAPLFFVIAQGAADVSPLSIAMCVGVPMLVYLLQLRRNRYSAWKFSESGLMVSSAELLAIILSTAVVLALAPVPMSAAFIMLSAMAGVALASGEPIVDGETLGRGWLSAVAALAIAVLLGYVFSLSNDSRGTLVILFLILMFMAVSAYLQLLHDRKLRKQIVVSREQQIEANRRSLSALEVKSEMTEKDLNNKLDIKRKELVDFALSISGQKKYNEELYARLQSLRRITDLEEKDKALDDVMRDLHEHLYFTNEMNDFYAQSEILNKDFNMRLSERFPDLTEKERQLSNLLRQGFSSKYIASLMNITPKSVEINRYRLRSKLGLTRSDNLINFIKSI